MTAIDKSRARFVGALFGEVSKTGCPSSAEVRRAYWRAGFAVAIAICTMAFAAMGSAGRAYALSDASAAPLRVQATGSAAPQKPSKAQLKAFKKASADFALELFRRSVAAKGKNANVCVAPLSVLNALAVTANGAAGKTQAQMRKVLAGSATLARMNKNLAWYNSKLTNTKKATIESANSIWYHNDGTLVMKKAFLKAVKKYYSAEVKPVDFSKASTVEAINSWIADRTHDMIKNALSQLEPGDRIAIVNALYFDAKWKAPFEPQATTSKKFTNARGAKRTVKMMHSTERLKFVKAAGVRGFIKPYAKGYSYVALLPDKGASLKKYVAGLTGDKFRKLVAGAKYATVSVSLPKHSLEYTNEDMGKQLSAMGMKLAFTGKANFSRMAADATGNLSIGAVVHKTRVDVDEQGTKAAAVTAVTMKTSSFILGDIKKVNLNRPFIYAIVDNATKLPVFIGTVNDIT